MANGMFRKEQPSVTCYQKAIFICQDGKHLIGLKNETQDKVNSRLLFAVYYYLDTQLLKKEGY